MLDRLTPCRRDDAACTQRPRMAYSIQHGSPTIHHLRLYLLSLPPLALLPILLIALIFLRLPFRRFLRCLFDGLLLLLGSTTDQSTPRPARYDGRLLLRLRGFLLRFLCGGRSLLLLLFFLLLLLLQFDRGETGCGIDRLGRSEGIRLGRCRSNLDDDEVMTKSRLGRFNCC